MVAIIISQIRLIVNRKYGYDNVGFHLDDDYVTFDLCGIMPQYQRKNHYARVGVYLNDMLVMDEVDLEERLAEREALKQADLEAAQSIESKGD